METKSYNTNLISIMNIEELGDNDVFRSYWIINRLPYQFALIGSPRGCPTNEGNHCTETLLGDQENIRNMKVGQETIAISHIHCTRYPLKESNK